MGHFRIRKPAGLVVFGGHDTVRKIGLPRCDARATSRDEGELESPCTVASAPRVPVDVVFNPSRTEARLNNIDEFVCSAFGRAEFLSATGRVIAFCSHGPLVALHMLNIHVRKLGDRLDGRATPEHGLDVFRSQRGRMGLLNEANGRGIAAHRRAQSLINAHRVPLALSIEQNEVIGVLVQSAECELAH